MKITPEQIKDEINDFIDTSPDNYLSEDKNEKAFHDVLVGFSRGDDPLFQKLKLDIGDFYLTPLEIMKKSFPDKSFKKENISVISWILPQSEKTKKEQKKMKNHPSKRWAGVRVFGENFNMKIRRRLVDKLKTIGIEAVAPQLASYWKKQNSEKYGFASSWSERHGAFVSGLGTFGLSDGLITPFGKAMRCGSVVANHPLKATKRSYTDHHEYCLFYSSNKCKKCIERCPAGAISEKGHDKIKCKEYIRNITARYSKEHYGFISNSCGLCQVAVPCESKIPLPKRAFI